MQRIKIALTLFALLFIASAVLASAASVWHGYSQSTRNNRIINRGDNDIGDDVGMQCKEWVREVVKDASNNVVTLPSTKSNGYQWNSSSNVEAIPQPSPATMAGPGCIIQMKWTNQNGSSNPHTAIVLSRNSSGMTWLDCNWHGDEVVRTHFVSYSAFYAAVDGYKYTLYYVK